VKPSGLSDNFGFPFVVLGVEDLVRNPSLLKEVGKVFRIFNRTRPYENRTADSVVLLYLLYNGVKLGLLGLKYEVWMVYPYNRLICRDNKSFKSINFIKFFFFCFGCTSHT